MMRKRAMKYSISFIIVCLFFVIVLTPAQPVRATVFTFAPVADAPVRAERPDSNLGSYYQLKALASPENISFLRFDVQNLDAPVTTATLRLYSRDSSTLGITLQAVSDNSWGEMAITYNNAPPLGSVINTSGAIAAQSWVEIDVSSHITGEGLFSLAVTTADANLLRFFSREGTHVPELIVETDDGPPTPPPTLNADFTADPVSGNAPLAVTFTDNSTGSITGYDWDFGDGGDSTQPSPVHTYAQPGIYTVSLTVAEAGGLTDTLTRTNYISVTVPVTADFVGTPLSGTVPLVVTFTNTSTGADSYEWGFGDGITSTEYAPVHTYAETGIYDVTLTVRNQAGDSDTKTEPDYITVSDEAIGGLALANDSPTTLGDDTLFWTSITAGTKVTYTWDFGDGTGDTSGSSNNIGHTYTAAGVYTATVTAGNLVSQMTASTQVIIDEAAVGEQPPWWDDDYFYRRPLLLTSATPITDEDITNNTVSFTLNDTDLLIASDKLQADGSDLRVAYWSGVSWSVLPTQFSPVVSPTATITFSLQAPITDTSSSYWLYYGNAVADSAPKLAAPLLTESHVITGITGSGVVTPTVFFYGDTRQVWAPGTVNFTSEVTPASDTYIWDFGDGVTATETLTETSHTYVTPGVYTVTLTAVTSDGMEVTYGFADYIAVRTSRNADVTIDVGAEEIPIVTERLRVGEGEQSLVSAQEDLRVTFPESVITQTMLVTHTPFQATVAQNRGNLNRFDVSVTAEASGDLVTQFAQPVTLALDIAQYGLTAEEADTLLFFYWDDIDTQWQPITTTVDFAQGTAWAETDHFTEFAVATNFGLGAPPLRRLPSVSGGGVDQLTGASTYEYPLEVPPGTHGMQPNLSLVYNSGAADTLLDQQAGLVGLGFELAGLGWIQLDVDTGDYYLNLNGRSEKLIQEGSSASYRTEHPTYWQIELLTGDENGTGKYWQVTTQDGTLYRFGYTLDSSAFMPYVEGAPEEKYRFELEQIQDTYGNTLTLTYEKQPFYFEEEFATGTLPYIVDVGIKPYRIDYTSNAAQSLGSRVILFNYAQPDANVTNENGFRADYEPLSMHEPGPGGVFGYQDALASVEMYVAGQHVRTYVLDYQYYTQDSNPPTQYGPGTYHLMLASIQEEGVSGSSLPPTVLAYAETGHLQSITNGYGGHVLYTYEKIEDGMQVPFIYHRSLGKDEGEEPDTDRWRVSTQTVSDLVTSQSFVTSYQYGATVFVDEEYKGHQRVQITTAENNTTTTYYSLGSYYVYPDARAVAFPALVGQPYLSLGELSTTRFSYDLDSNNAIVARCSETIIGDTAPALQTCYSYDEYGNVARIDENNERVTTIEYLLPTVDRHNSTLPTAVNQFNGDGSVLISQTSYDYVFYANSGAVESVTITKPDLSSAAGPALVTYNHFDLMGNMDESWVGSSSYGTSIEYDPLYKTFPDIIYYADGSQESFDYDARFGQAIRSGDIRGAQTYVDYDDFGRPELITGENNYVSYEYSDVDAGAVNGLTVRMNSFGKNDYLVQSYNGLGRLYRTTDIDGNMTEFAYDSQGRSVMSTLPYANISNRRELENTYDALGRPLSVETRDSVNGIQYTYPDWQTIIATDPQGILTEYELDAFGRITAVGEAGTSTTYYSYLDETPDFRLQITDPAGNQTTIAYDSLGRKVSLDDPDMGNWTYTYDERGHLETQTDARGVVTTMAYDLLGRLLSKSYDIPVDSEVADTANVNYVYPSLTRTEMWDGSGHTIWEYDVTGLLLEETKTIDGGTYTTEYEYSFGRLETITYPDGEVVTYTYNAANQIVGLVGENTYLSSAVYDPLGQALIWELGGIATQVVQYNSTTFRPALVETTNLNSEQVQDLELFFDVTGRLDWWTDNSHAASLWLNPIYDGLNRLDAIDSNNAFFQQDYDYDAIGNLTDRNGLTLTYAPGDRPHLPGEDSEGTDYEYDANGNLASSLFVNAAAVNYTYDAENRLAQVISDTVGEALTTTLTYDGNGQLVLQNYGDEQNKIFVNDYLQGISNGSGGSGSNLSNSLEWSDSPFLAINGDIPYFVWGEEGDILFYRLDDPTIAVPVTIVTGTQTTNAEVIHFNPSLAVDGNGTLHAVWKQYSGDINPFQFGTFDVYYSYSEDGGSTWSEAEPVSTVFDINDYESGVNLIDFVVGGPDDIHITVDAHNNVHVMWQHLWGEQDDPFQRRSPKTLHRVRLANGAWESNVRIVAEAGLDDRIGHNMVTGPGNTVYAFLRIVGEYAYYQIWDGTSWGTQQAYGSGPMPHSMEPGWTTVDAMGTIHALRLDDQPAQLSYLYKTSESETWSEREQMVDNVPPLFELVVSPEGVVNFVYFVYGNDYEWIMYTTRIAANEWSQGEVLSTDFRSYNAYYFVASADTLHFVYEKESDDWMYQDIFYSYSGEFTLDNVVKNYYVGEQRVATRSGDGTLHYHVDDPTGTSQLLLDANGDEAGRMIYDGFGGVLTITLPVVLTDVLSGMPDKVTGLVHLGGGRWYDPALGRPLQPNATGGPPTVPQALNRYAATPLGQPGVYQAAVNGGFNWIPSAASFSYGLTTQLAGRYGHKIIGVHQTGYALVKATASHSALTRNFRRLPRSVRGLFDEPAFAFAESSRNFYTRRGVVPMATGSVEELYKATDEIVESLQRILPENGPWAASVTSQIRINNWPISKQLNQLDNWGSSVTRIGTGLDFALGFGFQLANDSGSPYLTSGQVLLRATFAGGGSAALGYIGGSLGLLCGPAAIACVPVGAVAGGLFWSEIVQPWIFQATPFKPAERNLLPLSSS